MPLCVACEEFQTDAFAPRAEGGKPEVWRGLCSLSTSFGEIFRGPEFLKRSASIRAIILRIAAL